MDLQTLIVIAAVGAALVYTGSKVWNMVKPGPRTAGCGCGTAKSGCGGCPLVKP